MIERIASHWWLFVLRGVIAVLFGLAILAFPFAGLFAIAIAFGIYMLLDGIVALAASVRMNHETGRWIWLLVEGILGIVAGGFALVFPGAAVVVLTVLLGAWAIITGGLAIASAFDARRHLPNEWLWVLAGIVSVLFGIAVFAYPLWGIFALVWMVAVYALIAGFSLIGFGIRVRGAHRRLPGAV